VRPRRDCYRPRTQGKVRWEFNKDENNDQFLLIILNESEAKSNLVDLDVDAKIILKWVN